MTNIEAMKLACPYTNDELRGAFYDGWSNALRQAISEAEQVEQESKCKDHPDAPHGFCRDESITQDRYVCECEFWEPPKAKQEPDCVVHNADTPGHFAIITPALPAGTKLYTAPPKAEQEPVAIVDEVATKLDGTPIFNGVGKVQVGDKLYTAPPQREWVSLTDDERRVIGQGFENENGHVQSWMSFARAIESKLKEKNRD